MKFNPVSFSTAVTWSVCAIHFPLSKQRSYDVIEATRSSSVSLATFNVQGLKSHLLLSFTVNIGDRTKDARAEFYRWNWSKPEVRCRCYVTEPKQDARSNAEMSSGFSANQVISAGFFVL